MKDFWYAVITVGVCMVVMAVVYELIIAAQK